MYLKTWYVP